MFFATRKESGLSLNLFHVRELTSSERRRFTTGVSFLTRKNKSKHNGHIGSGVFG